MKKLITALLVPILCLRINMNVFASPATTPTSNPDELLNELNQEMEEINHYIKTNIQPLDIKNQTVHYTIPLSTGKTAEYSIQITKCPLSRITILDAKVGTWYFDSTLDLPNHGSIKVRTTVNITEVPTSSGSIPKFTAYDGKVTAIPSQLVSVDATTAETVCIIETAAYKTVGYVGFNIAGRPANFYYEQYISFVDNKENYDKIQVSLTGEF